MLLLVSHKCPVLCVFLIIAIPLKFDAFYNFAVVCSFFRMLREIYRQVDWVKVGGRWTRMSVMGADLSPELLTVENKGENDNRIVILMVPGGFFSGLSLACEFPR